MMIDVAAMTLDGVKGTGAFMIVDLDETKFSAKTNVTLSLSLFLFFSNNTRWCEIGREMWRLNQSMSQIRSHEMSAAKLLVCL
jgi:hypothetical protein